MYTTKTYWPIIIGLALLKFIVPLLSQHPIYELQRDEFLYYEQGLHPALGYLENPPLLSYLATISSWFGGSEFSLKFWPCLFGATTVVITCLIAKELGGGSWAQFLAGLGISTGAYVRVHYLFQPNFLDIFSWTLAIYFLVRFINSKDERFIYGLTISLALGWWSKYSVSFMAIAIIIGLVSSPYRKILLKKNTWTAVGISVLIILPNFLWQYFHNWPLIHHMAELKETQLKYINKKDFIMDQFMMLLPALPLWITGLVWVVRQPKWQIIAITFFSVVLLLLFGSGKGYYTLGAYPMLIAAGAVAWEKILSKRTWIRYVFSAAIIILTWLILPMLLPVWKPAKLAAFYEKIGMEHRWEDLQTHPLPQDFADMLGWKELTEKTEKFYESLPATERDSTIIFGRHYGHSGSNKFYARNKQLKERTFTDVGSFLLWIPDKLRLKNIILIARRLPDDDDEVFNHFEKFTIIDSVTNPYSRQFGDKIIFFQHIDSSGLHLAEEGLRDMKKRFSR